jgi:hypothetical protein
MLRCHRRHEQLIPVLEELSRYHRLGLARVVIHVLADRPTSRVMGVLENHKDLIRTYWEPNFKILSKKGERFREAKREQFQQIKEWPVHPDWVLLQDDDRWFEPISITGELPTALNSGDTDVWLARSLFVWDRSDQVNVHREHLSPILFRFRARDDFPLDRDIQAPIPLHDEAYIRRRASVLETPLLDYGTFSESERKKVFEDFFQAFKRDPYVYSIQEPPELVPLDTIFKGRPWEDLWRR